MQGVARLKIVPDPFSSSSASSFFSGLHALFLCVSRRNTASGESRPSAPGCREDVGKREADISQDHDDGQVSCMLMRLRKPRRRVATSQQKTHDQLRDDQKRGKNAKNDQSDSHRDRTPDDRPVSVRPFVETD